MPTCQSKCCKTQTLVSCGEEMSGMFVQTGLAMSKLRHVISLSRWMLSTSITNWRCLVFYVIVRKQFVLCFIWFLTVVCHRRTNFWLSVLVCWVVKWLWIVQNVICVPVFMRKGLQIGCALMSVWPLSWYRFNKQSWRMLMSNIRLQVSCVFFSLVSMFCSV